MRRLCLLFLALILVIIPVSAQNDDVAYLRAAHFSVDAPSVDIYVDGELTLEAFDFPVVSDWVALDAGTYQVDIAATGDDIDDAVLSDEYDLSADDWATLAVVGEVEDDSLQVQVLVDDLSNIADDEAFVSVFHAIADLDPVNVLLDDTELIEALTFPNDSDDNQSYASDAIEAGDYDIDIQDEDGESLLTIDTTTLSSGRAYFVAAVGTADDPQFVLIATDVQSIIGEMDDEESAEASNGTLFVRVGHFSVSAPAIDVYLNEALILENADFGDVSDYIELDAGIYDVALVPTGESLDEAAYDGEISLNADSVSMIAAIGFVEDDSLDVIVATENNQAPTAGMTRIAFFQAIPSSDLYDLSANDNTLIQGVAYPSVFDGAGDGYVSVDVVANGYEFMVDGAGNTINVGNLTAGAGRVYLIVSAGTEDAPIFFLVSDNFPSSE